MEIIFYSTHCPRCNVLKSKMDEKGIFYKEINDTDEMIKRNIQIAPVLEVDGEMMDFGNAIKFINNYTK